MKLSSVILVEALSQKLELIHIHSDIDLCISDVRLYSQNSEISKEENSLLYLLRPEQLPSYLAQARTTCFAVAGGDLEISISEQQEYFVFSSDICFEDAFTALQDVFRNYQIWESALLQGMIGASSIDDLMAIAARYLPNPIALFDVSFVLIATGGEIPPDHLDSTWADVVREGYFPMGVQDRKSEELLWNAHKPFRMKVGTTTKASACIRYQGKIIGYLGMTDLRTPITDGQLSILYAIQRIFESTVFLSGMQGFTDHRFSTLLTRLLRGYSIEKGVIDYYLRMLSWHNCKQFHLFLVMNTESAVLRDEEIFPTIQRLKTTFRNPIIFPFEDSIVIVSAISGPENRQHLNDILSDRKMLCIESLPFYPFSYLRHAYLQCRMTLSCVHEVAQPCMISFYEKYQECILSALSDSTSLSALCNPYIFCLKKRKNGMDFIRSLRVFLMHGKNYSEAATELHVHRNTLIYRIERMEQYLEIDFHAANEQTLFQLYLSCLICERSVTESQEGE